MGITEIVVLALIAIVVIAAARVLMNGVAVILVLVAVAILLGGYSVTQFKDDAGQALKRGGQIACPDDAAVQLRAASRRHARIQQVLSGTTIGPQRREDLEVESATLKAKITRLTACVQSAQR
jgi:nitrogen fixation-related uncharacterized protein